MEFKGVRGESAYIQSNFTNSLENKVTKHAQMSGYLVLPCFEDKEQLHTPTIAGRKVDRVDIKGKKYQLQITSFGDKISIFQQGLWFPIKEQKSPEQWVLNELKDHMGFSDTAEFFPVNFKTRHYSYGNNERSWHTDGFEELKSFGAGILIPSTVNLDLDNRLFNIVITSSKPLSPDNINELFRMRDQDTETELILNPEKMQKLIETPPNSPPTRFINERENTCTRLFGKMGPRMTNIECSNPIVEIAAPNSSNLISWFEGDRPHAANDPENPRTWAEFIRLGTVVSQKKSLNSEEQKALWKPVLKVIDYTFDAWKTEIQKIKNQEVKSELLELIEGLGNYMIDFPFTNHMFSAISRQYMDLLSEIKEEDTSILKIAPDRVLDFIERDASWKLGKIWFSGRILLLSKVWPYEASTGYLDITDVIAQAVKDYPSEDYELSLEEFLEKHA